MGMIKVIQKDTRRMKGKSFFTNLFHNFQNIRNIMITLHSDELYRFVGVEFGSITLPAEVSNSFLVCGDVLLSFMCRKCEQL